MGPDSSDGNSFICLLAIQVDEEERVCDVLSHFFQYILAPDVDLPCLHGRVPSSNGHYSSIPPALGSVDEYYSFPISVQTNKA